MASFLWSTPLSVRNNNPGNLKYVSSNQWVGSTYSGAGRFEQFNNKFSGMRAMLIVLTTNVYVTNSVEEFVLRYAREKDETIDTPHLKSYVRNIERRLGYSGKIKVTDITKLMTVVVRQEGGQDAVNYFLKDN